jgi:hypothetical protein
MSIVARLRPPFVGGAGAVSLLTLRLVAGSAMRLLSNPNSERREQ